MNWILTTILTFAVLPMAQAATGLNSSSVVLCPHGQSKSVDYYEAETIRKAKIDLGPANLNYKDKLSIIVNRIARFSEPWARQFKKGLSAIENDTGMITNADFTAPVVVPVQVPAHCTMKTVLVEINPRFAEGKRYLILKDIWNQLNEDAKTGLIFRLVLAKLAQAQRETSIDDLYIRGLNAMLASADFAKASTRKDWQAVLKRYHFDFMLADFKLIEKEGWVLTEQAGFSVPNPTGIAELIAKHPDFLGKYQVNDIEYLGLVIRFFEYKGKNNCPANHPNLKTKVYQSVVVLKNGAVDEDITSPQGGTPACNGN